MPQDCPKLRNACESCHRRKIRCQIAPNQSACRNCAANGTACLFAPRIKTGRPRLVKHASVDTPIQQVIDDEDIPGDSLGEKQNELPAEASTTMKTTTTATAAVSNAQMPTPPHSDAKQASPQPWLLEEGALQELDELQRIFESHTSDTDLPMSASDDHQSIISVPSLTHIDGHFQSPVSLLSLSSATTPPDDFDMADTARIGLDFNAALRLCAKLEEHLKSLQEAPYEPISTEAILGDIDLACRTVMQPLPELSAANDASTALVVAALYKIFEICEAFIRCVFGTPMQQTQSAEHLLLLKRLDLILLRAKIFLTRMGQHSAATKASRIAFRIESLVKQQYQHWMW